MLEFYKQNIRTAMKFAIDLENCLKTTYHPAVDAVNKIRSALKEENQSIIHEFQSLRQFFNGEMDIDELFFSDDLISYIPEEPLFNMAGYSTNFIEKLGLLGNLSNERIEVNCKLSKSSITQKSPEVAYLLDRFAKLKLELNDLGLTKLGLTREKDFEEQCLTAGVFETIYIIPVVNIMPAFGLASIVNKNIRDYPLILGNGEEQIIKTLNRLNYSFYKPGELERLLEGTSKDLDLGTTKTLLIDASEK